MIGKKEMKHRYLKKEDFYSHLNMEHFTNAYYEHLNKSLQRF